MLKTMRQLLVGLVVGSALLLIDSVQAVAPWSVEAYPNPTTVCTNGPVF